MRVSCWRYVISDLKGTAKAALLRIEKQIADGKHDPEAFKDELRGHSTSDKDKTLGWLVEKFLAEYKSRKGTGHYHKRSNKTRHASGAIFLDDRGQPIKAHWLSWTLRDTMKAAGISGASFRNFRHTFATRAVRTGIHAKTIGEMLGGSTESVVERYMHTDARVHDEAAAKMSAAIIPDSYNSEAIA